MADNLRRRHGVTEGLGSRRQEQADTRDTAVTQHFEIEGDRARPATKELTQIISQVRLGENGRSLDHFEESARIPSVGNVDKLAVRAFKTCQLIGF